MRRLHMPQLKKGKKQEKTSDNKQAIQPQKTPKKKRGAGYYWGNLLLKILAIVAVSYLVLTYAAGIFILYGNNMYPAVKDGDLCFMYRLQDADIGDVVSFTVDGKRVFGRIVARENDVIDFNEQGYQINYAPPAEEVVYPTETPGHVLSYPYTVPEGCVFIMNDFRSDINDSRTYGAVPMENLDGKLLFLIRRRGF